MTSRTRLSEVGVGGRNLERLDRAATKIGNKARAWGIQNLFEDTFGNLIMLQGHNIA